MIEENRTATGTLRSDLVTVVASTKEVDCPSAADLCSGNLGITQGFYDIEESSLTFNIGSVGGPSTYLVDTFNGHIYSSLDAGAPILGVSLITDIAGLDLSDVSFTMDSVSVNLSGLTVNASESYTVGVQLTATPSVPSLGRTGRGGLVAILLLAQLAWRRHGASTA